MSQRHHAITLSDGTIVFGLLGASGEEDEDTNEEDLKDGAQGGDGSEETPEGEEQDEESLDDLKVQLTEALAAKAEVERRMRMADRTAARYRTEAEELKRGKTQAEANGEVTLEDQIRELKAQLADRGTGDTRGKVRDEFLLQDKYQFHNRKLAFDLLDVSGVPIDDRGQVDQQALTDAVEDLVKEHPYLVKTADKKEDPRPKPERPSGSQPGAHRRDRKQVDRATLEKKYPQLYGRS